MANFDYDVVIIGSGFGGSVAALRAAEKGYRVGVMEAGRRWKDEDMPKTPVASARFLVVPRGGAVRDPEDRVPRRRTRALRRGRRRRVARLCQHAVRPAEAVLRRTGVGGHHGLGRRAGAVSRPGDPDARSRPLPVHADRRRSGHAEVAIEIGRGETFNKAPVGVYFGSPGVEADDPYFGGVGPRRTGCISCGNCNIGCGHNAKNKLTTNYLYLAEKLGARSTNCTRCTTSSRSMEAGSRCTRVIPVGLSEPGICTITRTPPSR